MKTKLTSFLILIPFLLSANLFEIKQDETGDFTTIQEGINASINGDTALVYPGEYFENIDFIGKSIMLASLEMITGNNVYIDSTIINGDQNGSCIKVINGEDNAVVRGFTITNGKGDQFWECDGGGFLIYNFSTIEIINCNITENYADAGGGIYIKESTLNLSGVNINNNYSYFCGGAIFIFMDCSIFFDHINRCNVYNNYGGYGNDIYSIDCENINVILDTFTVITPTYYFIDYDNDNGDPYSYSILNGFLEQVNQDLYVSPNGDDDNSGLSPDESLKTISWALHKIYSDSLNPKTVHLSDGFYSEIANDQVFPLGIKNYVCLEGENRETTILDGDDKDHPLVYFTPTSKNCSIKNCTVQNNKSWSGTITLYYVKQNIEIDNLIIKNCTTVRHGKILSGNMSEDCIITNTIVKDNTTGSKAGAKFDNCNAKFIDCIFDNNHVTNTPSSYYSNFFFSAIDSLVIDRCVFSNSSSSTIPYYPFAISHLPEYSPIISISNSLFYNNSATSLETHGITCLESLDIKNCTFTNNNSSFATLDLLGNINITNTIMYNEIPNYEIELLDRTNYGIISNLDVSYCDIRNGQNGIYNENGANVVNWNEGNINANPIFAGSGEHPYALSPFSSCINAGTPDTTGIGLPAFDIIGNPRIYGGRIDMGAYEYNPTEVEEERMITKPRTTDLTIYPNPFNPSTTVSFNLLKSGNIKLIVYNIKGQKVKTLMDAYASPGNYNAIWNGKDDNGKIAASGEYYIELKEDGKVIMVEKCSMVK